jgi:hypothetical protein
MRKLCVSMVLSAFVLVLPFTMGAQQSKVPKPLLDARYIQSGCCSRNSDFTYLRVFADGKVEWDEEDLKTHSFVAHQGALSGKQLNAVQWAIDRMKGLAKNYTANGAKRNIDDMLSFAITAREGGRDYHTEIFFGLPVDAENYSELRTPVRAVACTLTILRSDLSHEKMDLTFCRKYFVGM